MKKEDIKYKVVNIFNKITTQNNVKVDKNNTYDIFSNLAITSIEFISLVVELENSFNIVIPDDKIVYAYFQNISDIVEIIYDELKNV